MYLRLKKLYLYSIKLSGIILILLLVLSLCAPYINPYYFWPAALAGLAFPILWAATFVNALLLIKHRFWLLLMLIPIIAGLTMMLRHYNLPLKKSEPGSKNEYTIISYNVHGFAGPGNGKSNYEKQVQVHHFLNDLEPAVACMQEYAMKDRRHARYIDFLNSGLNLSHKHLSDFDRSFKGTSYTYVTSTNYPVLQEGTIFTMETDICGIYTDIQFPEGMVRVYNIHLQSVKLLDEKQLLRPDKQLPSKENIFHYIRMTVSKLRSAYRIRSYQALAVSESISKSPYPVIVAGDFNDTPASFAYRVIMDGMTDAAYLQNRGFNRTYAQSLYPVRIDHILISDQLIPGNYKRYKIWLSDHFPVSASFRFK